MPSKAFILQEWTHQPCWDQFGKGFSAGLEAMASEKTSRSLSSGGSEHPSILGLGSRGFIALPETGWRQKSGASLGALLATPWGW